MKLSASVALSALIFLSGATDCRSADWFLRDRKTSFFGIDTREILMSDPDLEMRAGYVFFLREKNVAYRGKEVSVRIVYVAICSVNYVVEFDPALTYEYEHEDKVYLGLINIESIEKLIPISKKISDVEVRKGFVIWKVPTEELKSSWEKAINSRRARYCPKPSA